MATFHLDLVAPDRLTFSGDVDQVDVPGLEGDFGVLANHAPTVSLLRPGVLTMYAGGEKRQFVVLGGFAEVSSDGKLTVLADVAVPVEDFSREALQAQISELEASIKEMPQDSELDKVIQRLDHFKQVDTHLQGTAAH
jgi:F-type H+-transporting ATPase subunit epsilon